MDTITLALVTAPTLAAIAAFSSSMVSNKRLTKVHELVNSRLSEALHKIDTLENRIYLLTGEAPTGEPPRKQG